MSSGSDVLAAPAPAFSSGAGAGEATVCVADLAQRDPDIQLMLQVQADEPGAFKELVERYRSRLVNVLTHLVGDPDEAEDLAQEVFLRVYRARKNYRPRSKFSTWLFTIANNLALNSLRARQRKYAISLHAARGAARAVEHFVPDHRAGPAQRLQAAELRERLCAALDALKSRQRTAVVLTRIERRSYAETAQTMGLTVKAVKSLLTRARVKLRAALGDYGVRLSLGDEGTT
jgi:RNA polymerase sigma-70 factor (ECF subfamily)